MVHIAGTLGGMEDLAKLNNLLKLNGTYYFRVRVPQDLLAALGKKEIKVSLRTKDPREVKSRLAIETLKAEELFEATRRANALSVNHITTKILAAPEQHKSITKADVERTVILWHRAQESRNAKNDDLLRVSSNPAHTVDIEELLNDYDHFLSNDVQKNGATIRKEANKIFIESNISLDNQPPELQTYAYQIVKQSLIEQSASSLKRFGHPIQREPFNLFETGVKNSDAIINKNNTLETIRSRVLSAKRSDGVTEKSLAGYSLTLDLAIEVFGADKPIESITPEDWIKPITFQ